MVKDQVNRTTAVPQGKPQPSLKRLALKGTFWTIISYGAQEGLRFGTNIVLTRLLAPEVFGLMALVRTFLSGLELFSDVGLRPNVIRSPRGEDSEFLDTAWTIQVMRGVAIGLCCFAIAFPLASFYDEPRLKWLIPIVGITPIISGFQSTGMHVLARRLEVFKTFVLGFASRLLSTSVIVAWALFVSRSVWALLMGSIVGSIFSTIISFRVTPDLPRNRFRWDPDAAKEIFSFGRWIFLSTIATFLASQSDRLILGKLLSFEQLGVYSLALMMADVPSVILRRCAGTVLMPTISKKTDLPRAQLRQKLRPIRALVLLGMATLLAPLVAFADVAIDFLYDERYAQAGWMLSIMALGIWPRVLTRTIASSLMAFGKPYYATVGNALKFSYLLIVLPLAYQLYGLEGVIVTMAFNDIPFYIPIVVGLTREKMILPLQDLLGTMYLFAAIAVLVFGRWQLGWGFPLAGSELFG